MDSPASSVPDFHSALKADLPEDFLFLCALARDLHRGNSSRPPLPVIIVLYIFHFVSSSQPRVFETSSNVSINVLSRGPEMRLPWFHTLPLTANAIRRGQSIQLETESHDQGWCSDPGSASWTWFDIVILDHKLAVKPKRANPQELCVYRSHHNPRASSQLTQCIGTELGPEHEIWTELEEGDRLGVEAVAVFPQWACYGDSAVLKIKGRWEPMWFLENGSMNAGIP